MGIKIYTFYSDFNEKYSSKIPKEIAYGTDMGKPIPEKYRNKRLDVFIEGLDKYSPNFMRLNSAQIWYSEKRNEWKLDYRENKIVHDKHLVKDIYKDTIKEVSTFPSYMPSWPLRVILMIAINKEDFEVVEKIIDDHNVGVFK